MKKFIYKTLLLFLLIVIIIQIPSWVLPPFWGNSVYDNKIKYLEETEIPYDTFFIGTSRVNNGIIPTIFDENVKKRTKTFNLAAAGSSGLENVELVKYLINHKELNVKTIFLEMPILGVHTGENGASVQGRYYYDFSMYLFSIKKIFQEPKIKWSKLNQHNKLLLNNLFKIGIFDNQLDKLWEGTEEKTKSYQATKGYNALNINTKNKKNKKRRTEFLNNLGILKQRKQEATTSFRKKEYTEDKSSKIYLTNLINMAEKKGIELYFVIYPKAAKSVYVNAMRLTSPKIKQRTLNLANPKQYNIFYEKEYSFDRAHLNHRGAKKLTEVCASAYKKKAKQ